MYKIEHLEKAPIDFLSKDPEDGRFHQAFQSARIPDFNFGYYAIWENDKRIAVIPYFLMDFQLNTMLPDGFLKSCLAWLKLPMACVGHPSTDLGHIEGEPSAEMLEAVNKLLL